jgi:hypothetical protein
MSNDCSTRNAERGRSRLAWMLAIAIAALVALGTGIKLQQDATRRSAQRGLRDLGFNFSIRSIRGRGSVAEFFSNSRSINDAQIDSLIAHITTLTAPYDLGFSKGLEVAAVDVSASEISRQAVVRLEQAFPNAEIRHRPP